MMYIVYNPNEKGFSLQITITQSSTRNPKKRYAFPSPISNGATAVYKPYIDQTSQEGRMIEPNDGFYAVADCSAAANWDASLSSCPLTLMSM